MNGPQHYTEAERLLTLVTFEGGIHAESDEAILAAAQVHATLALAAAQQDRTDSVAACAHGSTGICLSCLIPIVEHSLGRTS